VYSKHVLMGTKHGRREEEMKLVECVPNISVGWE
jgi:hypothetical protein